MLEALVSSRIRRALLEYILAHPTDRFYLRGLAKQLGLAVSPLRRELKRLQRSGMLTATPEANLLFYKVNTTSPAFLELRQATVPVVSVQAEPPQVRVQQSPWRSPILAWATAVGLALMLLIVMSRVSHPGPASKTQVTILVPPHGAISGTMRGGRWQVVPGGFGGFSSGSSATQESY